MMRRRPGGVLSAGIVVGAALGLAGCGFGAGGPATSTPTTAVATPTTVPNPATKLATDACQEFKAAEANPNPSVGYTNLFTADAEADSAGKLAAAYSSLAAALDTVKTQIQQIDQYQSGNGSNVNSNAATLSQAQGQLRGDLVAVATLCQAEGL
jgi:hypothetical protein